MGTASSFPYTQNESLSLPPGSVWTAHTGTRKEDGEPVTIFRCSLNNTNPVHRGFANNMARRCKTLKHPNILKFIDTTETPDALYVVTEAAEPLSIQWNSKTGLAHTVSELECSLGLYQVSNALKFMHSANLFHGAFSVNAIWVTKSGEWKLAGLETARECVNDIRSDSVPMLPQRYISPDLVRGGSLSSAECSAIDSWALGCFIYECFNGEFSDPRQLTTIGKVSQELQSEYKRLLATQPRNRLNMEAFQNSVFFQNDLVLTVDFLDNLALKGNAEKDEFFRTLSERVENFPIVSFSLLSYLDKAFIFSQRLGKYKILPQLMNALQFGAGTGAKVLTATLVIAKKLSQEEFTAVVVPVVVKLFSLNERAMRVNLLKNLSMYINFLDDNLVNKDIFPHVKTGFTDTVSVLREWTVKSLVYFIPKLKENVLVTQVLPFIPRLQKDPEAAIRTNTTVVVGKCAKHFSPSIREKLLIPTFSRALRDPFVPARKSSMAAFKATAEFYSPKDLASKVLPFISLHALDPSKEVRELTFSCMNTFLEILKKHSDEMPEDVPPTDQTMSFSSGTEQISSSSTAESKDSANFDLVGTIGNWAMQAATQKIMGQVEQVVGAGSGVSAVTSSRSYDPPKQSYEPPRQTKTYLAGSAQTSKTRTFSSELKPAEMKQPSAGNEAFFDDFLVENDAADSEIITALSFGASSQSKRKVSKPSVNSEAKVEPPFAGSVWAMDELLESGSSTPSHGQREELNFDLAIGVSDSKTTSPVNSYMPMPFTQKAPVSEEDLFKSLTIGGTSSSMNQPGLGSVSGSASRGGNKIPGVGRGPRGASGGVKGATGAGGKPGASAAKPAIASTTSKAVSSGDGWEDFLK